MSIISDTATEIQLGRIPKKIAEYELLIEAAAPVFQLSNKGLEESCKEHAQNLMMYDIMLQECKTIEDVIKIKVEEVESSVFKKLNEHMRQMITKITKCSRLCSVYKSISEIISIHCRHGSSYNASGYRSSC